MKVTGNMKNAIFSSHLSQLANTLTCGDDKVSVSRLHICNCMELNIDISETIRVLARWLVIALLMQKDLHCRFVDCLLGCKQKVATYRDLRS